MKIIITEQQYNVLLERIEDEGDFYDILFNVDYFVFNSIKNKQKIKFKLINPTQYKRALTEFIQYGSFVRFPVKYIFNWKDLVLYNIALLHSLTSIHGHSNHFPFDEFYDEFNIPEEEQDNDFMKAYDILDTEYHIDDYVPFFTNGHAVLSDFGVKPLFSLAEKLIPQRKPEDIIVTINKILDIAHQRSDLSELFVEGGQNSLSWISNDVDYSITTA